MKFKHLSYPRLIHPILVKEMYTVQDDGELLHLGAGNTLVDMEKVLKQRIRKRPGKQFNFSDIYKITRKFLKLMLWIDL